MDILKLITTILQMENLYYGGSNRFDKESIGIL